MRRTHVIAIALGAVLLAAPAFAQPGGGGGGGGLSSGTPGSPAAGNLGSTPQEMQGRSQQQLCIEALKT